MWSRSSDSRLIRVTAQERFFCAVDQIPQWIPQRYRKEPTVATSYQWYICS